MLEYLIKNINILFLFFTIPLAVKVVGNVFTKKELNIALALAIVLLFPYFFGYSYIWTHFLELLLYCWLSFVITATSIEPISGKQALKQSMLILAIMALPFFALKFSGSIETLRTWKFDDYQVIVEKDQGFAGGARFTYRLFQYSNIPLLKKEVDKLVNERELNDCEITFSQVSITTNLCEREINKNAP